MQELLARERVKTGEIMHGGKNRDCKRKCQVRGRTQDRTIGIESRTTSVNEDQVETVSNGEC